MFHGDGTFVLLEILVVHLTNRNHCTVTVRFGPNYEKSGTKVIMLSVMVRIPTLDRGTSTRDPKYHPSSVISCGEKKISDLRLGRRKLDRKVLASFVFKIPFLILSEEISISRLSKIYTVKFTLFTRFWGINFHKKQTSELSHSVLGSIRPKKAAVN